MPTFYNETRTEIYVDEFVSACNTKEITDLIDVLKEDGYLLNIASKIPRDKMSMMDEEWMSVVTKLSNIRLMMTSEEETIIREIVNKY